MSRIRNWDDNYEQPRRKSSCQLCPPTFFTFHISWTSSISWSQEADAFFFHNLPFLLLDSLKHNGLIYLSWDDYCVDDDDHIYADNIDPKRCTLGQIFAQISSGSPRLVALSFFSFAVVYLIPSLHCVDLFLAKKLSFLSLLFPV